MLYSFLEMSRAAMLPWRAAANMTRRSLRSPLNPASDTLAGRATAAAWRRVKYSEARLNE